MTFDVFLTRSSTQLKLRFQEVRKDIELAKLYFQLLDSAFLEIEERHLLAQEIEVVQVALAR